MAERWVTLATFGDPTSAHVARLALEGQGIRCFVVDENMGTLYIPVAVGGVKLQVAEADAERAAEILSHADQDAGDSPSDDSEE
jgi:hypothetical protein